MRYIFIICMVWLNKSVSYLTVYFVHNMFCMSGAFLLHFLVRDGIYAERAVCYRPSISVVRLSVCHTGGPVKRGWS